MVKGRWSRKIEKVLKFAALTLTAALLLYPPWVLNLPGEALSERGLESIRTGHGVGFHFLLSSYSQSLYLTSGRPLYVEAQINSELLLCLIGAIWATFFALRLLLPSSNGGDDILSTTTR